MKLLTDTTLARISLGDSHSRESENYATSAKTFGSLAKFIEQ